MQMGDYGVLPCNIEDVVELLSIPIIRNTGTQLHAVAHFAMIGRLISM